MRRSIRVVEWLFDRRRAVMVALAAVTVAAGVFAARVGMENRLEVWFLDGDPALASYQRFQREFGGEETIIVALHREDGVLTREGQALITRATKTLAELPEVAEVRSLATFPDVRVVDGDVKVSPLLPEGGADEAALKAQVLADPFLVGRLIGADGRTAVLWVRLQHLPDLDARRPQLLAQVRERLEGLSTPYRLAGNGVIYDALNQASTVDSGLLLGLAYAVMAAVLVLIYRRVWPVVVTLGAVGLAVVWTMGTMGLAGRDLNVVTLVVPTLVLIIGVSDCIHILQHVAEEPQGVGGRRERVARGVAAVLWPCLFNTVTSAVAFLSLLTSPMPVIRDLGLFCAIGLGFAFVTSVAVCVAALASARAEPAVRSAKRLQRFAVGIASAAERRPRLVLVASALLAVGLSFAALRLRPDTDTMGYFAAQHRVPQDSRWIEEHVGPYLPLEFLVHSDRPWTDPALLASVERWERAVEAQRLSGKAHSVADVIARGAGVLGLGPARIPADAEQVQGLATALKEMAPQSLEGLVSASGDTLRITFPIRVQSARGVKAETERILALAALPAGSRAEPSGYLPLYVKMMDYMVDSQLSSFAVAFALVFLIIGVGMRSFRLMLLAIPANVLPVVVVLGVMWLAGVPLDAATITIAALVLGLVVDDTVHLLYRLRAEEASRPEGAVVRTFAAVGPSMISAGLVLALGFAVLGFAQVTSVAYFGLLLALAMGSAILADLAITPALVRVFASRRSIQGAAASSHTPPGPGDESSGAGVALRH